MPVKKPAAASLLLLMALSGCATPPPAIRPAEIQCPQLPPAPADVMVPGQASFQERLLNFFSSSPAKPTK